MWLESGMTYAQWFNDKSLCVCVCVCVYMCVYVYVCWDAGV